MNFLIAQYESFNDPFNSLPKYNYAYQAYVDTIPEPFEFFLEKWENLKLVGENHELIKSELDKMLEEYQKKINLDNYWKIESVIKIPIMEKIDLSKYKYSCRYCGRPYNGRGYATAMGSVMRVPDENIIGNSYCSEDCAYDCIIYECYLNPAKRVWTEWKVDEKIKKEVNNRIIQRSDILMIKQAEWSEVVSFYGGYSELSKLGISKDDISKFSVEVVLDKIELNDNNFILCVIKSSAIIIINKIKISCKDKWRKRCSKLSWNSKKNIQIYW